MILINQTTERLSEHGFDSRSADHDRLLDIATSYSRRVWPPQGILSSSCFSSCSCSFFLFLLLLLILLLTTPCSDPSCRFPQLLPPRSQHPLLPYRYVHQVIFKICSYFSSFLLLRLLFPAHIPTFFQLLLLLVLLSTPQRPTQKNPSFLLCSHLWTLVIHKKWG